MKKLSLTLATLVTITLLSLFVSSANAQGVRLYVSRPVYGASYYAAVQRPIYVTPGYGARTVVVSGLHDHVWHDTSHVHYRRPTLTWHGDHFDYEPGQYEVHNTGHWDHVHSAW